MTVSEDGEPYSKSWFVGECSARCDNIQPTKAPINSCPRFIKDGIQHSNEFSPWFEFDPFTGFTLTKEENDQYIEDLSKIRRWMHLKEV